MTNVNADDNAAYEQYSDSCGSNGSEGVDTSTINNDRLKTEPPVRLGQSKVIEFVSVKNITKASQYEGAILLDVLAEDGFELEIWFPKKLCSNLDLEAHTVCIWDKFLATKLAQLDKELGRSLAIEPLYYNEFMAEREPREGE